MSEPSPSSTATIVPPYMGEHWRKLRQHLNALADLAAEAATYSTTEEIRPVLGRVSIALMDANFQLAFIERDGDAAIIEGEL